MEDERCTDNVYVRRHLSIPKMTRLTRVLDLPSVITIDILSRLPARTIMGCKCVCRKWLELLSSAEFVKYHHSRSIHTLCIHLMPRNGTLCKVVEFGSIREHLLHNLLSKPEILEFDLRAIISSDCVNIEMECSVDGLLCLRDDGGKVDALFICNPITREYIPLPTLKGYTRYPNFVAYGFGISSSSCQYKLVRIFHKSIYARETGFLWSKLKVECMVYTLGTGSWRRVAVCEPYGFDRSQFGAFVRGNLHWMVHDASRNKLISCFNLETESFKTVSPPFPGQLPLRGYSTDPTLMVLGETLCFVDHASAVEIVIWMMKEYGVNESWTREYVISKFPDVCATLYDSVYALTAFNNGDILLFNKSSCLFCYCKKTNTTRKVEFFEPGINGWFVPLLHTTSFLSLKRFAPAENVLSFESYLGIL